MNKISDTHVWYEINWPAHLDIKNVNAWLQAWNSSKDSPGTRFVIKADSSSIRHYLILPARRTQSAIGLIHTFIPDIELIKVKPLVTNSKFTAQLTISPVSRLLKTDQPESISYAILSSLGNLYSNETIVIEWALGKRRAPQAFSRQTRSFQAMSWMGALLEAPFRAPQTMNPEQFKALNDKYKVTGWHSALYIGISAVSTDRQAELCHRVLGAFRTAESPGLRIGIRPVRPSLLRTDNNPLVWPFTVNVQELTGLLGWPLGNKQVTGIPRIMSRRLAVAARIPNNGRLIATSTTPGQAERAITLNAQDALMHTHILGPTGVGKSTLLLNLICQDMTSGAGIVVIDPKGDLVDSVLRRVPPSRVNDVVVLDPNDANQPVGLNPLNQTGQPVSVTVDDILSVFRGLYGSYFGPRTQDILHAGLLTLASEPGMSLCALPILYSNPAFRSRLVSRLNDPLGLGSFWNWFETISDSERQYVLAPLMNKLRTFLMRPSIRRVIGQGNPKFQMVDAINNQKILLVNLAKGQLGSETAQLFGSLVVAQVWQTIQTRSISSEPNRKPCFVYIDEVQDYLHLPTDIADVLAQSRSYGVGLTMAHQHLGQLPPDLRNGVLANARSRICFQLSHEDAVTMSRNSPLEPTDFESLAHYEIYCRLVADGEVTPWASGKTKPAIQTCSSAQEIRALSRQRYGHLAADIETELATLIAGNKANNPVLIGSKKHRRTHR